ncbi:MAG: xanthine phosphoribosyltransferase [Clostridia bacterium]|nr:xanthine phosphoribosyltransferase [Clostridia bacterium]
MKALEDKILSEGSVLPGNVLKVNGFLNHRLDVPFIMEMGKEIARLFEGCGVNKILTIETSGIPIAFAAAQEMSLPVIFAKKHKSKNLSDDVYSVEIESFTHGNTYTAVVDKAFLNEGDNILIVDDFLAIGNAVKGLIKMIESAKATTAGVAVAIEKGFQNGGDALRQKGIRVEALALVDSMDDSSVTFRK